MSGSRPFSAQTIALPPRATERNSALAVAIPEIARRTATAIPGHGLPMTNNVFLNANYAWPFFVTNNRYLDYETYGDQDRWSDLPPRWYESGRPHQEIDAVDGTPNPFLQRWLDHPDYDEYWQAVVPFGDDFSRIEAIPFERSYMTSRRMAAGSRLLVRADVVKGPWHQVNHGTGRAVADESAADAGAPLSVLWHGGSWVEVPVGG